MPATVSADALPTPQIGGGTGGADGDTSGVVWASAIAGDTVFAGGNFTQATDPDLDPGDGVVPQPQERRNLWRSTSGRGC